jgi:hypothetical protein
MCVYTIVLIAIVAYVIPWLTNGITADKSVCWYKWYYIEWCCNLLASW